MEKRDFMTWRGEATANELLDVFGAFALLGRVMQRKQQRPHRLLMNPQRLVSKVKLPLLILFGVLPLMACSTVHNNAIWPTSVLEQIWLPKDAENINYETIDATYRVNFRKTVCFPYRRIVDELVIELSKRGWQRLETDPLNPPSELTWKRGDFDPVSIVTESGTTYYFFWTEYWVKDGDVLNYNLRYKFKEWQRPCILEVYITYCPSITWKDVMKNVN